MANSVVHFGDRLSILCEKHGSYLCSKGVADRRVTLLEDVAIPRNFERCVFVMEKVETWASVKASSSTGTEPLLFGSLVRLKHCASDLHVRISREQSRLGNGSLSRCVVTLGSALNTNRGCGTPQAADSLFKIMPRYRIRQEGERVLAGDHIVLHNEDSKVFLSLDNDTEDVVGSGYPEAFSLQLYEAKAEPAAAGGSETIRCGGSILIFHKEQAAFLTFDGETQQQQQSKPLREDGSHLLRLDHPHIRDSTYNIAKLDYSSNALWMLEQLNPFEAGPVQVAPDLYRLKHRATSKFMAVRENDSCAIFIDEVPEEPPISDTTLWALVPCDVTERTVSSSSTFFRLQNFSTSLWLHADADQHTSILKSDSSTAIIGTTEHSSLDTNHDDAWNFLTNPSGKLQRPPRPSAFVTLKDKPAYVDVFCAVSVPPTVDKNVELVLGHASILREYIALVHRARSLSSITGPLLKRCDDTMSSLISFLTNSDVTDTLRREGIPISKHQHMLLDQNIHRLVIEAVMSPFQSSDATVAPPLSVEKLPELLKRYPAVGTFYPRAFRFLKMVAKGNKKGSTAVGKDIGVLLTFVPYVPEVCGTIAEFHQEHPVDADVGLSLVDSVVPLVMQHPEYLRLLRGLCTSQGNALPELQLSIRRAFKASGAPPEVDVDEGRVAVRSMQYSQTFSAVEEVRGDAYMTYLKECWLLAASSTLTGGSDECWVPVEMVSAALKLEHLDHSLVEAIVFCGIPLLGSTTFHDELWCYDRDPSAPPPLTAAEHSMCGSALGILIRCTDSYRSLRSNLGLTKATIRLWTHAIQKREIPTEFESALMSVVDNMLQVLPQPRVHKELLDETEENHSLMCCIHELTTLLQAILKRDGRSAFRRVQDEFKEHASAGATIDGEEDEALFTEAAKELLQQYSYKCSKIFVPRLLDVASYPHPRLASTALSTAFNILSPTTGLTGMLKTPLVFDAVPNGAQLQQLEKLMMECRTLHVVPEGERRDQCEVLLGLLFWAIGSSGQQSLPLLHDMQNIVWQLDCITLVLAWIDDFASAPTDVQTENILTYIGLLEVIVEGNASCANLVVQHFAVLVQLCKNHTIISNPKYFATLHKALSTCTVALVADPSPLLEEIFLSFANFTKDAALLVQQLLKCDEQIRQLTTTMLLEGMGTTRLMGLDQWSNSVKLIFYPMVATMCSTEATSQIAISFAPMDAVIDHFLTADIQEIPQFVDLLLKYIYGCKGNHFDAEEAEKMSSVLEKVIQWMCSPELPASSAYELVRATLPLLPPASTPSISTALSNLVSHVAANPPHVEMAATSGILSMIETMERFVAPSVVPGSNGLRSHIASAPPIVQHDDQQRRRQEALSASWVRLCHTLRDKLVEPQDDDIELVVAPLLEETDTSNATLRSMIAHLTAGDVDDYVIVNLLLCLQELLNKANDDSEARMVATQNRLQRLDATPLISMLLERRSMPVVRHAIKFGIALLEGGNKNCQDSLLHYFNNNDEKFFLTIRNYLKEGQRQMIQRKSSRMDCIPEKDGSVATLVEPLCRLLQLLTEGHHLDFQNYVRHQHDNFNSYNMCFLVMELLHTTVEHIDETSVSVASQALNTLTEVCQGPCQQNQAAIVGSNVVNEVNKILTTDYEEVCDTESAMELKCAAIITLLSLLEGGQDTSIPNLILTTINIDALRSLLEHIWTHRDDDEDLLDLGFNIYILAKILVSEGDKIKSEELRTTLRATSGHDFFDAAICNIEIWRDDDPNLLRLETVYFRKPDICKLRDETKEVVLNTVDRSSLVSKHSGFFRQADDLIFTMEYQYLIEEYAASLRSWMNVGSIAACQPRPFEDLLLCLGLVSNLLLISGYQTRDGAANWRAVIAFFLLGFFQFVISVYLVFVRFVLRLPLVAHQRCPKGTSDPFFDLDFTGKLSHVGEFRHIFRVATEFYTLFFSFFAVCSLLGVFFSPYFYCFLLLLVCHKSPLLGNIVTAITVNGKQLLLTGFLGVIMVYFFSVVGFLYFSDHFPETADGKNNHCDTLLECFFFAFGKGVRGGGGISDELKANEWSSEQFVLREAYDTGFFVIIAVIVMNIVFALIVDTFAEQRDERKKIEEDMRTTCFVCGIDAATFDREGEGFSAHTKGPHNMWQYLYFMHHLRRKDVTEFTGQESYVFGKMKSQDLSFFPVNRSKSLQKSSDTIEADGGSSEPATIGEVKRLLDDSMKELKNTIGKGRPRQNSTTTVPSRASALWSRAKQNLTSSPSKLPGDTATDSPSLVAQPAPGRSRFGSIIGVNGPGRRNSSSNESVPPRLAAMMLGKKDAPSTSSSTSSAPSVSNGAPEARVLQFTDTSQPPAPSTVATTTTNVPPPMVVLPPPLSQDDVSLNPLNDRVADMRFKLKDLMASVEDMHAHDA